MHSWRVSHADINGQSCNTALYLSSVEGIDYVGQSAYLAFSLGDSQSCHIINIIQDDFCEFPEPEDFFANLSYVSGIQNINIIRDRTQVLIDDSNEPECGELKSLRYDGVANPSYNTLVELMTSGRGKAGYICV